MLLVHHLEEVHGLDAKCTNHQSPKGTAVFRVGHARLQGAVKLAADS